MSMPYRPDTPTGKEVGGGPIVGGLALGLVLGLLWELLLIQTDWRLGFSPPVWEIVVGWIGLSAFSAFVILVFGFAGLAIYSTNTMARNPQSWDARQAVADARVRAAAFTIGLGGLMAFGGAVMWAFSRTGPEFEEYGGFARFTAFMGVIAVLAAVVYVKKDPDSTR
jgi:hypothetical protein